MTSFIGFRIFSFLYMEFLENMTMLRKTAKEQIYLWIVSTVKITDLQTCNIHKFKESTKYDKYVLASFLAWQNFHNLER